MNQVNRRNFLKASGIVVLPALLPAIPAMANHTKDDEPAPGDPIVKFFNDGEMFDTTGYIAELNKINSKEVIRRDFYGQGGAVANLEKKMEEITGKEKAMMMPTGTLANQLAIAVLSGEKTKVYVQDTSHVYRDEADAAQSVFQKRLMPLARNATFFTADQLKEAVESLKKEEVFESGIGAVSVENPVRRTDGRMVPIEEIKKISAYCRANNIKLHLDGARLYMASAWSGISIREYASYFDTVYISLYKYLGAGSGAILCGDKTVIDKMPHLIKIHGGTSFSNWYNAAIALDRLTGIEERLRSAIERSKEIFAALNKIPGVSILPLDGGTNMYALELTNGIEGKKVQETLNNQFNIRIPLMNDSTKTFRTVNETLLYKDTAYIINAFSRAIKG